jgi:dTDP-glucose 4,6-dehydratase
VYIKMYRNILITGGLGFIGLYVVEKFCEMYPSSNIFILDVCNYCSTLPPNIQTHATIIYQDITDLTTLKTTYQSIMPDLVIHLAAETHVDLSYVTSSKFIDTNVTGTHNLLECVRHFSPTCKFIHMSTDEVYGSCESVTLDSHSSAEYSKTEDALLNPTNPYSASKASAEMLVNAYTISYKLNTFIVRCNNAYGARQFPEKIIPKFITMLLNGEKCTIHGDGNKYYRHYIHASDIANAIYVIVTCGVQSTIKPEIYNISSDSTHTNLEVLQDIINIIYTDNRCLEDFYVSVADRPFNDIHYNIDATKLSKLGFTQKIDWQHGLRDTVTWYMSKNNSWWVNDVYKHLDKCQVCENMYLTQVIDLGRQSPANEYFTDLTHLPDKYPLKLNVCEKCWHLQLSHVVSPSILFKNYMWMSGVSEHMKKYFTKFANLTDKENIHTPLSDVSHKKRVLEIACNDGSQLDAYKQLGYVTVGIDPAENLAKISSEKGHTIICDFFEEKNIGMLQPHGPFDIIVAQNVFAHVNDIHGFLRTCKKLMHAHTKLYIQTSQANMIMNGEFDTIYHEHISFFSARSMRTCLSQHSLYLDKIELPPIHGTSYLFTCSLTPNSDIPLQEIEEEKEHRYRIDTYKKFEITAQFRMKKFGNTISSYKERGYTIIGYGASAKANVFLSSASVSLDYIVDDNHLKQDKYCPNVLTPIVPQSKLITMLTNTDKIVIVILCWNLETEISEKIRDICHGIDVSVPDMITY